MTSLALKSASILLFFYILVNAEEDNITVKIKNGLVLGYKSQTVSSEKSYYGFRGIPYAEPPVGGLRFKAPQPARNWTGIRNATVDGNECPQNINDGFEDCLFINVYTPNINSTKLLPVMVWVHGGYFIEGNSTYSEYGPDYFLDEDVIIVTFNYRLGVFGFFSTGDDAATGNWGLKDQVLALRWVQDNIGAFGGNASRVTLFGESAGGACVCYLLQSSITQGLYQRAIMQSGTSLDLWSFSRHPRATAFNLGLSLGISTDSSTLLVEELRKIDYKKLLRVSSFVDIGEIILTNPRNGLVFAPTIEPRHEGAVVSNKSHEVLKNGSFNKVPVIVGFNSQEGIPFGEVLERLRLYLLSYDLFPTRLIPVDMNINPSDRFTVAQQIRAHYFGSALIASSNESLIQYVTDDQFARPINEAVRLMSKFASTYYYRFSYTGVLGIDSGRSKSTVSGVGHAEDLNYLWRRSSNIQNPTENDLLTRRKLVTIWVNFAKTSNPTPKREPLLDNVKWIPATTQTQYYLDIGQHLVVKTNLSQYSIQWWRSLYKTYGHPPYGTF